MSIEHGGPSMEEMGLQNEAEKQSLEITGTNSKEDITHSFQTGRLTTFQTGSGEIQVFVESVTGDDQLTIKGAASGAASGEVEITYDPATGKGTAHLTKSESPNPFAA